jgi:uncharacterized protein
MGIEVRPLGVACNLGCQYCYQNPQRDAGNIAGRYDLDRIKAAVEREGGSFILFGGEPLLVPEADLEDLWAWGLAKYGRNGIQTNATLISDNHIRLFRQYKVHVGISIDGPGPLNDARWAGTLERTRDHTERAERALERLCREGLGPSIIVTLHRGNATQDKIPILQDWFHHLDQIGVVSARLHILEVDHATVDHKYALSPTENAEALVRFADLEPRLKRMSLDLFGDLKNMLLAEDDLATCVWKGCDPLTTEAVRGIEGFGQRSNCGRTNKDGIDFVKADERGFERYIALYRTPHEVGGCSGCRFFLSCKGQCPGTAIGGDWRNRTEHCEIWLQLFGLIEDKLIKEGKRPISLDANLKYLEANMLSAWAAGMNPSLASLLGQMRSVYNNQNSFESNTVDTNVEPHTDKPIPPHFDFHKDTSGPPHDDFHGDNPHSDTPMVPHFDGPNHLLTRNERRLA